MKTALLFSGLAAFAVVTEASELNRDSVFDSVDEFVTAMKAFRPAASNGKLSALFTTTDRGDDEQRKSVTATTIESCDNIWSDEKSALLFVTVKPPTVATDSHIGVLFLLIHGRDGWRIADVLRFAATGNDSGVSAELTALAGSGRQLGREGFDPVVTIKESQGGRGYAYDTCASYKFAGPKLKRFDLE